MLHAHPRKKKLHSMVNTKEDMSNNSKVECHAKMKINTLKEVWRWDPILESSSNPRDFSQIYK